MVNTLTGLEMSQNLRAQISLRVRDHFTGKGGILNGEKLTWFCKVIMIRVQS